MNDTDISPQDARRRFAEGAMLIDVREQEEWDERHVEGALLIPLGEFDARIAEYPKDRDLLIICRSGRRSGLARDALRDQYGFDRVYNVAGGMIAWAEAGLPVTP